MKNWVDLQADYDCRYFVADLHALTTDYADTSAIRESTLEAVTDWLSVGLDPEKSVIFVQSRVPQTAELALVFGMITPLGWLERVPTYKEQIEQLRERDLGTFGFLGYPVLMTADIALYRAHYVPVGKDQESHLEICREIVRRFNGFYGDVFPGAAGALHGDAEGAGARRPQDVEELRQHDRALRLGGRRREEGHGHGHGPRPRAPLRSGESRTSAISIPFHVLYSPPEEQKQVDVECRTAARGCVDCKKHLIRNMNAALEPVRQKRAEIVAKPGYVKDVLEAGNERAAAGKIRHARDDGEASRIAMGGSSRGAAPPIHFLRNFLSLLFLMAEGIRIPVPAGADLMQPYPVKLPMFEGPLDLLLHLIRKNEVDIREPAGRRHLPAVPRVHRPHGRSSTSRSRPSSSTSRRCSSTSSRRWSCRARPR